MDMIPEELKRQIRYEHQKQYQKKNKEKINAYRREKYKNNEEHRERLKAYQREKNNKTKKYNEDPEYRTKMKARSKKYYQIKKTQEKNYEELDNKINENTIDEKEILEIPFKK